ncbi:MAG: hypothetical protein H7844_05410 [Nitrospirae bacterium YQR-1]
MYKCIALIPVRKNDVYSSNGEVIKIGGRNILDNTIATALKSKHIEGVFVATDSEELAESARSFGAQVPFLRPGNFSAPDVTLPQVLKFFLDKLRADCNVTTEIVVFMEVSHPYREAKLIDEMVETMYVQQLDSVFTVIEEKSNFWQFDQNGNIKRVYEGNLFTGRKNKNPLYREVLGLVCVTYERFINDASIIGQKLGIIPVRDVKGQIDLYDDMGKLLMSYIEHRAGDGE